MDRVDNYYDDITSALDLANSRRKKVVDTKQIEVGEPINTIAEYLPLIKSSKKVKVLTKLTVIGVVIAIIGSISPFIIRNKTSPNKQKLISFVTRDTFSPQISEELTFPTMEERTKKQDDIINPYEKIDLCVEKYAGKYYLKMDESDMLYLIKRAIDNSNQEYSKYDATSVFSATDKQYSRFTPEMLLAVIYTESGGRLLEIKDKNKSLFSLDNMSDFIENHSGINYYSFAQMSEDSINDHVDRDRDTIYNMQSPNYTTINNKKIEIIADNFDTYTYVKNSGAKTKAQIITAVSENFELVAKTEYEMLNRIVKDFIKRGSHDESFNKLKQLINEHNFYLDGETKTSWSNEKIQLFFAFLSYNEGGPKIVKAINNETLFDKDKNGKYIYNLKYPKVAFEQYENIINRLKDEKTIN